MTPADTMRAVYLTPEEISFLMNELHYEHNEGNFEPDCPSCTAYRKLAATKPSEDEIRAAMQASTQDTVPAWADDVLRRAAAGVTVDRHQCLSHQTPTVSPMDYEGEG